MKTTQYFSLFVSAMVSLLLLTGCPNPENKIPANCFDGILNNNEQLIDCGGPCEECDHCIDGIFQPDLGETWLDCGGECGACDPCANGIQDSLEMGGDETGVDCGGTNCGPCGDLCGDGLLNGNETQIDCDDTAYVDVDGNNYYNLGDIYTGNCQICPTCIDEIMNGNEVGIDCGGSMCSPCATDGNCTNGVVDGNEFWTDCGGSTCPYCDSILDWNAGATAFTSLSFIKTFSGYSFDVTGTTLTSEMLNIKCAEPAAGWLPGTVISMNPSTTDQIAYTKNGVVYSTLINGASGSFTLTKFDAPATADAYIRGTFTGTLKSNTGATMSITNGMIQIRYE